jgi:hypothetical protein
MWLDQDEVIDRSQAMQGRELRRLPYWQRASICQSNQWKDDIS